MSDPTPFGQAKYQVRFDWGAAGIDRITADAHVVVLVDALSFTTTVVVAAEHGVAVAPRGRQAEPAATESDAARLAERLGGVVARRRGEPGPTLSPASFVSDSPQPPLVVLHSPNGGALASLLVGRETDESTETVERPDAAERTDAAGHVVLAASMRNRTAVAEHILALQQQRQERIIVAVIAAGERPAGASDSDGSVRFAIEDQLVGGAVIDALVALGLDHTSPEAAVACAAFEGLAHAATHLIGASGSAMELKQLGFAADVRLATERDVTGLVPELREGVFRA